MSHFLSCSVAAAIHPMSFTAKKTLTFGLILIGASSFASAQGKATATETAPDTLIALGVAGNLGTVPAMSHIARHLEEQLQVMGRKPLSMMDVRALVAATGPHTPLPPPANLVERLARAANIQSEESLNWLINHNDYKKAESIGQTILAGIEPSLSGLGDIPGAIENVGHVCLHLIRVYIDTNKFSKAHEQAEQCIRLVPNLTGTGRLYPMQISETLVEVRKRLDARKGKSLLEVLPMYRVPKGCQILVNGCAWGSTPAANLNLPAGDYQVRLSCQENSFKTKVIHVQIPEDGDVHVKFDPWYASSFFAEKTDNHVRIELPAWNDWSRKQELNIAAQLGATFSVSYVVLMRRDEPFTFRVTMYQGVPQHGKTFKAIASVRIKDTLSENEIPYATIESIRHHLETNKFWDLSEGKSRELAELDVRSDMPRSSFSSSAATPSTSGSTWGMVGLGLGALAMGAGYVTSGLYYDRKFNSEDEGFPETQRVELRRAASDFKTATLALQASALGLMWISAPFALPEEKSMPWYGTLAAALGIGELVIGSVAWMAGDTTLGPGLALSGLGTLAIPGVYWIRGFPQANPEENDLEEDWQGRTPKSGWAAERTTIFPLPWLSDQGAGLDLLLRW